MIVQYKAELKSIEHGEARVHIERLLEGVFGPLLIPTFEAILQNMKDTDKRAFYAAMADFAENDFDDLSEFIDGECDND